MQPRCFNDKNLEVIWTLQTWRSGCSKQTWSWETTDLTKASFWLFRELELFALGKCIDGQENDGETCFSASQENRAVVVKIKKVAFHSLVFMWHRSIFADTWSFILFYLIFTIAYSLVGCIVFVILLCLVKFKILLKRKYEYLGEILVCHVFGRHLLELKIIQHESWRNTKLSLCW